MSDSNYLDAQRISKGEGCKYVHLNCRSLFLKLDEIDFISPSETSRLTCRYIDTLISLPDKEIF